MNLECIIIDDEPLAVAAIRALLAETSIIKVLGEFNSAKEAEVFLNSRKVDLMFLDIRLPSTSGLEFIRKLKNAPEVIITTADPNHALEGFELNVIDYLLKPISRLRLQAAINKARIILEAKNVRRLEEPSSIYIRANHKLVNLELDQILYFEAYSDYVKVYVDDKCLLTHKTLSSMEEELPKSRFLRVHRSFIVQLSKIQSLSGNTLYLGNGKVPVGRSYKKRLIEQLSQKQV